MPTDTPPFPAQLAAPDLCANAPHASRAACQLERDQLRDELARKTEALRDIADKLPCDEPCRGPWCAGCVARAALTPTPTTGGDANG